MAEKKNQHYVPKFYLRHFSKSGSCISVYNFKSSKVIAQASIDGQASKKYFYGRDLFLENRLGELEGQVGSIFADILKRRRLPLRTDDKFRTLCLFMMIQDSRTTASVSKLNEMANKLGKEMLRRSIKDPELLAHLPDLQISMSYPFSMLFKQSIGMEPIMRDLKLKIIHNVSSVPFIASDHPVVFQNQFYDNISDNRCRGLASAGLQILLPISPQYMLMFYDDVVYDVGSIATNFVRVPSEEQIEALNGHQWIGAMGNVFFPEGADTDRLLKMAQKYIPLRKQERVDLTITSLNDDESQQKEVIKISSSISHVARLSICRPRIKKTTISDGYFPLRNDFWVASVRQWERALMTGQISFDEFWLLTTKVPTVKKRPRANFGRNTTLERRGLL